MKKATDNLIEDHDLICDAMEVMEHITVLENPEVEILEFIVEFIKEYADGYHHAKEEGLLFPKLVEKGMPREQGPIGVMLMEHDKGRGFVKGMSENIGLYKSGRKESLTAVYQNMNGYVNLLRDHINKENNILFRMADNFLTREEQIQLLQQFALAEKNSSGYNKKELFASKIKDILAVYQ